jgi:serine/threonine protein kinase
MPYLKKMKISCRTKRGMNPRQRQTQYLLNVLIHLLEPLTIWHLKSSWDAVTVVLNYINYADESVDWWGVGVILYQLLTGVNPFYAESDEKTFENILLRRNNGIIYINAGLHWPKSFSPQVKSLIDGMLTVEVTKRLGFNGKFT